MSLGEMKKNALLEAFKDVVIGKVCMGDQYIEGAISRAKAVGLSEADLEWAIEIAQKPDEFRRVFGEKALGLDFQALLKVADTFTQREMFKGLYSDLENRYPQP